MRYFLIAVVVIGAVLLVRGIRQRSARVEAHRWVDQGALLLDVRSPAEFAEGHLPGAVNIPVDELQQRISEAGANDRPLVVYCRSGVRSTKAEALLRQNGYQRVLNLGPKSAW